MNLSKRFYLPAFWLCLFVLFLVFTPVKTFAAEAQPIDLSFKLINDRYINANGSITSSGDLFIDLRGQDAYPNNAAAVNVVSQNAIDLTDIQSLSVDVEVISAPTNLRGINFNFGITNTDQNFQVDHQGNNSAFPGCVKSVRGKNLTFPLTLDVSDITGEYFITFGFTGNYYSSNPTYQIKFKNLSVVKTDGSSSSDEIISFITDYTDQVKEDLNQKLGVLTFGEDVLDQFFGLFENPGEPVLTFPSFSIPVDGQNYHVWEEKQFNFNEFEENFSFLVSSIRTVLVLFVWLAVLNYIIKIFERLFGEGSL